MGLSSDNCLQPASDVVSGEVAGEAILVQPAQSRVRMLNKVGTRFWNLNDGSRTLDEVISILHTQYDVNYEQLQTDILNFAQELIDLGLMVVVKG